MPAATSTHQPDVDQQTARLLNEMQERFPLVANPYAVLGERLGLDERESFARAEEARRRARELCVQFDKAELAQFNAIKRAFDPKELLNPGKGVPTPRRCSEYRQLPDRGYEEHKH